MRARQDRRRAPRVTSPLIVRYQAPNSSEWHVATLKDMSCEGARFVREDACALEEPVRLRLSLPISAEPVEIGARVTWQRPVFSGALRMAECGVTFTWLPPEIRRALEDVVHRALSHIAATPRQLTHLA